jgi:hypothetical protein
MCTIRYKKKGAEKVKIFTLNQPSSLRRESKFDDLVGRARGKLGREVNERQ